MRDQSLRTGPAPCRAFVFAATSAQTLITKQHALIWTLATIAIPAALATTILVGLVRVQLLRRDILDRPNSRSSHDTPVPRGGGIGVILVLLPFWAVIAFALPATAGTSDTAANWVIPFAALVLAAISWIDDLRSLGALPRLGVQFVTTFAGVLVLPGLVFQGLFPAWLDAGLAAIGWIWFVNLFNFMDGIDGISGAEAIGIGAGIVIIGLVSATGLETTHLHALAIAATATGFLVWNWPPAKIFLGDIGSVPLGYLLGWLLLVLAATGNWPAALILPLYYLADATLTLLRRLRRGEKVWQAHREHFYQQAVQNGRSHGQVSTAVALVNIVLIVLAVSTTTGGASANWPLVAIALSATLVIALLVWMKRPPRRHARQM